jgi:type IV pilus assembly protein PilQ
VVFAGGRGAPVDLDLQGVDIADVCRLLADVGRVNIVVADGVHGAVTLRLRRVPWDRALEVILQTKGLRAESAGDIIIVRGK